MTAFPLLGGIEANEEGEFVQSVPINLEPVAVDNKIAAGQFRAPAGAVETATGPGVDRGAICRNGRQYRVMGTSLVEVVGDAVTTLGDVGGQGPVSMDYGFNRVAVRSGTSLFYYSDSGFEQVTDVDLGTVLDVVWVDGYFMTTDGTNIIVTELNDSLQVEPLKYGSAEEDPDMVTGLVKIRGEVYATGRYTIEVLQNVGGNGFPFAIIDGATIPYGCVSASAKCPFADSFAFVGSARNEALGVYVAGEGTAGKISTRALDRKLAKIKDYSVIECEARGYLDERRLLVHLPDETWVYCLGASAAYDTPIWYIQKTNGPYRARHAVESGGQFYVGDAFGTSVGTLDHSVSSHFGETVEWSFNTAMLSNEGLGFIIKAAELIGLPGRVPFGDSPVAWISFSRDGETYSTEKRLAAGRAGERLKRLQWRPNVHIPNYCTMRFRGFDSAMPGFTRLELMIEPLSV